MSLLFKKLKNLTNVDYFVIINCLFFIFMCVFVYFARFIKYIGSARIGEFFIYAILIILVIMGLWGQFRKLPFSFWTLFILEFGIIIHFLGGLVFIDGKRLYDCYAFSFRYDKYVHFVNAFAVGLLLQNIFIFSKVRLGHLRNIIVFFVVLGLGAFLEIFEYLVTRNIKYNGVGGYDNNMQDLISNVVGIAVSIIIWKVGAWRLLGEKGE